MTQPADALLDHAIAARGLSGDVCGDLSLVRSIGAGLLVAVIDGLGHGTEAARAAVAAAAELEAAPDRPIAELVERCHAALLGTRGVAMTLAALDPRASTMTWLAIGNVEGVLLRAEAGGAGDRFYVQSRGGVVGHRLPALSAASLALRPGDLILFATDGIQPGFERSVGHEGSPRRIADRILDRHGKGTDDALVLVARWCGGGEGSP